MKKLLFTGLIGLFVAGSVFGQQVEKEFVYTGNPLIRDIYTADPTARVWMVDGKERLYLYPSHDMDPPRGCDLMDKYHVYSTEDMVNWVDHGQILEAADVPWGEPLKDGAKFMWAPDCAYKNGKYYFYFPHPNKDNWGDNWKTGIAVSDQPASGFVSLNYWMKGLPNYGYIDPCVFIDDDGQAYFYYGGSQRCFGAKLKDSMDEIDGSLQEMTSSLRGFHEGAWVFKRENTYYMMYPAGINSSDGDELRYAISTNPLGPWTYKGQVLKPTGCGTSHGSIVEFKGQWYLFYHNQALSGNGTLRSVCFDKLYFNEDGTIQTIVQTKDMGTPYQGIWRTAPGTIEAEDFNEGGQSFAYWDLTATNAGMKYRTREAVDIYENRRYSVIYVSDTADKEYLNYSFEALESGIYDVDFTIGSVNSEQRFYLEFDQVKTSNPKRYTVPVASIPDLKTITASNITLEKGQHTLTFYPQGNLIFDKFTFRLVEKTGIQHPEIHPVTVTPNPSQGIFQIRSQEKGNLQVRNIQGQTVLAKSLQQPSEIVDLSKQAAGIYILSLQTKNGVSQQKIIKQ